MNEKKISEDNDKNSPKYCDSYNEVTTNKDCDNLKKNSSSKLLIAIVVIGLVVIIAIISWFIFFSGKPNPLLSNSTIHQNKIESNTLNFSKENIVKQANLNDNSKSYSGKFNLSQGFADIVDYALPAVVNVSAEKTVDTLPINLPESFINPFLKEFFKQFNVPTRKEKAISLGSGFIVRSDGFVVTNFHVIKGAKNIKVTLHDGKVFDAKLYASDALTDLALLKINANNLSTLEFGDSSKARVGDWVIAIGNPFGLGGTVSSGIVSARGRDINISMYDEFIQTDAAINRGNSGGPMIDTKGRIIGVNTAIFSTTGGSIGIGFAVPSNVVKNIVAQLITDKKVIRGWIGVQIQDVDDTMAQVLKLSSTQGAIVSGVTPDSPGEKAGLKVGDVIIAANGMPVENKRSLPKIVSMLKIGDKITLTIVTNGVEKNVDIKIGKLPISVEKDLTNDDNSSEDSSKLDAFSMDEIIFKDFGFKATYVTDGVKKLFNLPKDINSAVIITAVEDGSIAEEKGLIPGLIISTVNGKKITDIKILQDILKDKSQNSFIFLLVEPRRNIQFFISLVRDKNGE